MISINSIQKTLGEPSNSLSSVCKSENINKWSKRKPYAVEKYAPLEDSDVTGVRYGLQIPIYEMDAMASLPFDTTWLRLGPSSIFRLSDFNGYVHTAESPFKAIDGISSLKFKAGTNYTFKLNLNTAQKPGSITVSDLVPKGSLYTLDTALSKCYFGMALYRNTKDSSWAGVKASNACQFARRSNNIIDNNSSVTILDANFSSVTLNGDSSAFYLVFFLTPTAFANTNTENSLTPKMIILEGGVMSITITKKAEQYPILWGDQVPSALNNNTLDTEYYKLSLLESVTAKAVDLEEQNELATWVDTTMTISKNGGRFSLTPTTDMANLAYYDDSSIYEIRLRISIYGISDWAGNYIPTFDEGDQKANNCEFLPIIQYPDIDGNDVYIGIVYEYNGSSTSSGKTTYTWTRYIAFCDGSSFVQKTEIDTISYTDAQTGTTKSVTAIDTILIQQNMDVADDGNYTGVQVQVFRGASSTKASTSNSLARLYTENAIDFGITTPDDSETKIGSKYYHFITQRVGSFNLQLRIQPPLW